MHRRPSISDSFCYFTVAHIGLLINIYWTKEPRNALRESSSPPLGAQTGHPCRRTAHLGQGPLKGKPTDPRVHCSRPPWDLQETSCGQPPLNQEGSRHRRSLGRCNLVHISFLFLKKFIYILFLAALGLCCCTRAFSSCSERGLLFVAVRGLLSEVASLVAEHGL